MKVAIVSVGTLPIPSVDGGAVETLIDNIVSENEKSEELSLDIYSIYSEDAKKESFNYSKANYFYIKVNKFIQFLDSILYALAGRILNKYTMSYRYIMQRIFFSIKIRKYLRQNYDVIIFEASQFLSISLIGNKLDKKTKIVFHVHNQLSKSMFLKYILKKSDCIISVSNFIKEYLIDCYKEIDKSKFITLRNQIDSSIFKPNKDKNLINELKSKYNIHSYDKVIVFIGRISKEKGVKELCQAISKIENNNIKLLIIGSAFFNTDIKDKYKLEIENVLKKIEDRVIFTGYINHNEVPNYLAIGDIAVLPSLCEEAASLANMEVLSCGIPLITTIAGGTPEYVNNKCSVMIKRDERLVDNIAYEIKNMIMDHDYYTRLKKEAVLFHKTVGIDKFYNDLVELLNQI